MGGNKNSSKKYKKLILSSLVACFIFIISANFAHAGWFTDAAAATFYMAINIFLYAIWTMACVLLIIGAVIFDWAVKPEIFTIVVRDNVAIVEGWRMVRDFLNLFFILILLFSAFCTIFQIDKYNLKKVLLTLIIMALLVNFSFPIARFIIDVSNVTMYYFINSIFPQGNTNGFSLTSMLAKYSFTQEFNPWANGDSWGSSQLTVKIIAAIIFTFLFAASLVILGILLVIRMVVLAVLIIFSPVGFVAAIFPGFSRYSSDWWSSLLKQAFFGPIMAFMLLLALRIYQVTNKTIGDSIRDAVSKQGDLSFITLIIVQGCMVAIFIVILWVGMMSAQKIGATGAAIAHKGGMNAMKKFSGANFAKRTYGAYQSRRKESDAHSASKRLGNWLGSKQDQLRSQVKVPGAKKGAQYAALRYQRDQVQKMEEASKLSDTKNMSPSDLKGLANSGGKFEKAAAIMELASREMASASQLDNVRQLFGADGQVTKQIEAKMKSYDPAAVYADVVDGSGHRTGFSAQAENEMRDFVRSNQFDSKKLSVGSLGNAELMNVLFQERAINNKTLEDLRSKSDVHANTITGTMRTVANTQDRAGNYIYADANDDISRNIQIAHYAQNGRLSYGAMNNEAMQAAVYSRLDRDTFKRTTAETASDSNDVARIASYMRPNVYKAAVANMVNDEAQRALNTAMQEIEANDNPATRDERNAQSIARIARTDHDIQHIHN